MGKSDNGPDWQDCTVMMAALGELHAVDVSLIIQPGGERFGCSVELIAVATRRSAPDGAQRRSVSRKHPFPNASSKTFEGAWYRLLHELDLDCSSFWVQEPLPV